MSEDTSIAALLEKRAKLEKQLVSQQEIQKNIEAIDRVLKLMNPSKSAITPSEKNGKSGDLIVPPEYLPELTWEQKCIFAISLLKEGFVTDVGKKIHQLEPPISIQEAENRAKFSLSKLFRDGKLRVAAKQGKRYKYAMIQK